MSFCRLISEKFDENWSDKTIVRLVNYACNHTDLELGKLNIHCNICCDEATVSMLFDNAINCVRGAAAQAIGQLLWDRKALLEKVRPGIESLIADPHPVIQIASIETIFPVFNIDRDLAVNWFCLACRGDSRVAASPKAVRFFNYVFPDYFKLVEPIVQKMVYSPLPEVALQGARQVTARNLFHGLFEKEFHDCLCGTTSQRQGVANVAVALLNEKELFERCHEILVWAMNDPDKEVRDTLSGLFRGQEIIDDKAYAQLVNRYIRSKAFADDPDHLVWSLNNFSGKLDSVADAVFAVCEEFAILQNDKTRRVDSRFLYRATEMSSVLLRLYESAQDTRDHHIADKCLDVWDLLIENRVGRAQELTKAIEK